MTRTRMLTLLAGVLSATLALLGLANPAQAAGHHYVALGDSYASGVGAGSYTSESGTCKRSTNAFSARWAAANAPASYTSVACAGAKTTDVINSQVAALSSQTTLVSITIGGNDAGFGNIMSTCALRGSSACIAAVDAAQAQARANLPGLLDRAYAAIRGKAPNARVVVLSYPVFYQLGTTCIGIGEAARAKVNEGINLVDSLISAAAARAGFTFADVRSIFVGHQICSGNKWIHAVDILNLSNSYHPMVTGQTNGYLPVFTQAVGQSATAKKAAARV
ncbi:SGNH/GDSL hydrolase family protein [Micromonospora sp. LOL_025]|uniref:SGNH/GDSL hydrolase family protein n=1 Tax=Micromonospora sp. LOL_025 TaxID=3345413 RepID=UPI003A8402D5